MVEETNKFDEFEEALESKKKLKNMFYVFL